MKSNLRNSVRTKEVSTQTDTRYTRMMKMEDKVLYELKDECAIGNIDIGEELSRSPRCPIFYDEEGKLINSPNPHDLVIKGLREDVEYLDQNHKVFSKDEMFYNSTVGTLHNSIFDCVSRMYRDVIINAVQAFVHDRILPMYRYTITSYNGEDIEAKCRTNKVLFCGINKIIARSLTTYELQSCIDTVISCYNNISWSNSTTSIVEKNNILYYNIRLMVDKIISSIASGFNDIARSTAFGFTHENNIYGYDLENLLNSIEKETGIKNINPNMFFFLQSTEFMQQLYAMIPMIELILCQMCTTLDYLHSDEIDKWTNRD